MDADGIANSRDPDLGLDFLLGPVWKLGILTVTDFVNNQNKNVNVSKRIGFIKIYYKRVKVHQRKES